MTKWSLSAPPEVDTSYCQVYTPILPQVVWMSDAKAYVRQTDADYRAFDLDVNASTTASASFKSGWQGQLAAWSKFRDDALGSVFFGAASIMDTTDRFVCALKKYRDAFVAQGGKPASPDPAPPGNLPPSPKSPGVGIGDMLTTLGIIAVVGAAVVVGGIAISKIPHRLPASKGPGDAVAN